MKNRKIQLPDGQQMTLNDNEWRSVVNRKKFDAHETEIARITEHTSGLMSRVYVMRAVDGKIIAERNEIVTGDGLRTITAKAITECGLQRISPNDI